MQVLCKSTNGSGETRCCVCGKEFVMYWERQSRAERTEAMYEIQKVLRSHHRSEPGPRGHPESSFLVPEWKGPISRSGVATPGHPPTWAL